MLLKAHNQCIHRGTAWHHGSSILLPSRPLLAPLGRKALWGRGRPLVGHHQRTPQAQANDSSSEGWLAPDKEKRLVGLLGSMFFEFACTGGLFWSPLLCALLFIIMTPGAAYQQEQQEQAVKRAVDQIRKDMEARVPVTPSESAGWMNRMMAEIWEPFVVPQVLKDNLSAWQEKVRATAPPGWDIDLIDMSLGREGPTLSNYQVYNNSQTGRMMVMECDMLMDSSSMRVVVRGSGPLGSFTASVTGVTMRGRMRIQPIPEQRMILWSYVEPPDATVKLQVRGPLIGERDLSQFSFIKSAFKAAIQDSLVEPRRAAISLDYEYLVQQAVDTYINVYVESIDGLLAAPPDPPTRPGFDESPSANKTLQKQLPNAINTGMNTASRGASPIDVSASVTKSKAGSEGGDARSRQSQSQGAGSSSSSSSSSTSTALVSKAAGRSATGSSLAALRRRPAVLVSVTNLDTKLQRRSATRLVSLDGRVALNELIKLELGGKEGAIEVQVRDASRNKLLLGRALIHVMASKDGCTLIWALGKDRQPQALRWQPAMGPWRVILPLENCSSEDASVTLGLSADPWVYSVPQLPAVAYKTPGPRTIVMQIMEAKELAAKDWAGTSDPYVQINYSGSTFRTRTIYNSLRPVWGETFVLPENPSLLTRRVRLSVWDSGVSRDDSLGTASISLDLAIENAIQDRWIQLSGEDSGEVRIRMAIVPGVLEASAVTQMVALLSSNYISASMSTLQVVVVAARGLMPRPAALNLLGSERNAYASISYAGARQVTSVVPGSTSPTWNHSSLFPLDLSHLQKPPHTSAVSQAPAPPTVALSSHSTANTAGGVHAPNWNTNTSTNPLQSGISRGAGSLRNWPYPAPTTSSTNTSTTSIDVNNVNNNINNNNSNSNNSNSIDSKLIAPLKPKRSSPAHVPSVLRLEVRDVDVVPPDGDLGYAELDVSLVVPVAGSVWEQWLPLREGGSGEVLVRLAHISPSAAAQGALPLPPGSIQMPEPAAGAAAAGAGRPAGGVGGDASAGGGKAGGGSPEAQQAVGDDGKSAAGRVEQQVLDSITAQARGVGEVAQAAVQEAGHLGQRITQQASDLRVKLGQDWIPKVQGWWKGVATQAQNNLSSSISAVIPPQSSTSPTPGKARSPTQQGSPPASAGAGNPPAVSDSASAAAAANISSSNNKNSSGSTREGSPPARGGAAPGGNGARNGSSGGSDGGAPGGVDGRAMGGGSTAVAVGGGGGGEGGLGEGELSSPPLGPDVFTPWQPTRSPAREPPPMRAVGVPEVPLGSEPGKAALSWIGTLLTTTWPPSASATGYASDGDGVGKRANGRQDKPGVMQQSGRRGGSGGGGRGEAGGEVEGKDVSGGHRVDQRWVGVQEAEVVKEGGSPGPVAGGNVNGATGTAKPARD